ncbi:hypothetical protein HY448_02260 [Candidatus Pacearchaeota archaeon]|nr:hypothetical protein [Candidatus Pacearchaeota archaeon]
MTLTPLEIISLIFVVFGFIKIFLLISKRNLSYNYFVKPLYKHRKTASVILLIAGGVVLYYLLQELNMIQIFAALVLFGIIITLGLIDVLPGMYSLSKKAYRKNFRRPIWFFIIVFLITAFFVLYKIFSK